MQLFENHDWLFWMSISSLAMFVISIVALPVIVLRLPRDFFCRDPSSASNRHSARSARDWFFLTLRTCIGIILIVAGMLMLFLPGQGVLTLLFGLTLLEFPGKRALQRKLMRVINTPSVIKRLNAIRQHFHRPLLLDPHTCAPHSNL